MPLIDITNPEIIKFLVENYEKTTRLTMKWNLHHKEMVQAACVLHREDKNIHPLDVFTSTMMGGLPAIVRDHESAAYNRRRLPLCDLDTVQGISKLRKGHSIVDVGLGDPAEDPLLALPDTDLRPAPTMRPVKPEHTEILYKDKPIFGREVYLKTRQRIKPEDKYYFPKSSAWLYGWRMNESYFGRGQRRCGRVQRLKRDMASRRGPATKTVEPPCSDD